MSTQSKPFRKTLVASITVITEDAFSTTKNHQSLTQIVEDDGVTATTRTRTVSDITTTELSAREALFLLADVLKVH